MYGGTIRQDSVVVQNQGLSPRVRGNPDGYKQELLGGGSIPACTGEPSVILWMLVPRAVYPRVYGGTWNCSTADGGAGGLSPRVRGNLRLEKTKRMGLRSIPACTGEPLLSLLGFLPP